MKNFQVTVVTKEGTNVINVMGKRPIDCITSITSILCVNDPYAASLRISVKQLN